MTLDAVEFLRRFFLHVLPNGFVRIRHYGLLSNRFRNRLPPLAHTLLAADGRQQLPPPPSPDCDLWHCPRCGKAIVADVFQMVVFPIFIEGAASPADDILDLGIGAVLVRLLGWHWEFLPPFVVKLVPGVDLVPLWTLAVANVYRKQKQFAVTIAGARQEPPAQNDSRSL